MSDVDRLRVENARLRGATSALIEYVAGCEHDPERARALVRRALDALRSEGCTCTSRYGLDPACPVHTASEESEAT
jgi:hypothetical protein